MVVTHRGSSRSRRWTAAQAEHREVLAQFVALVQRVPAAAWQAPLAPGKWSPSALTLHVIHAYEFGRDAAQGHAGMRLRVPALAAWVARQLLLPVLLARRRFPRGAESPREVAPDLSAARSLTPAQAIARLEHTAREAVESLAHADTQGARAPRVVHAYFGALSPLQALRLLSAHTRHHGQQLGANGSHQPTIQ